MPETERSIFICSSQKGSFVEFNDEGAAYLSTRQFHKSSACKPIDNGEGETPPNRLSAA